jgi:hypothetical protein
LHDDLSKNPAHREASPSRIIMRKFLTGSVNLPGCMPRFGKDGSDGASDINQGERRGFALPER